MILKNLKNPSAVACMYLLSYYKSPQMIFFRWKQKKTTFFSLSRLFRFRINGVLGCGKPLGPALATQKNNPGRFAMPRWLLSSPNRKKKKSRSREKPDQESGSPSSRIVPANRITSPTRGVCLHQESLHSVTHTP